jgi:hypothetical protein
MPDDDGWARRREIEAHNGVVGRLDGLLFRASARGATPLAIRVDLDEGGR